MVSPAEYIQEFSLKKFSLKKWAQPFTQKDEDNKLPIYSVLLKVIQENLALELSTKNIAEYSS